MKLVMRNCRFDSANGFNLGRHHVDAQFYFLDCKFSAKTRGHSDSTPDLSAERRPSHRGGHPAQRAFGQGKSLGRAHLFFNCHRDSGDFVWFANNLSSAPGAPKPNQITAAWTFVAN
jgi:pectinesterase